MPIATITVAAVTQDICILTGVDGTLQQFVHEQHGRLADRCSLRLRVSTEFEWCCCSNTRLATFVTYVH